MTGRSAWRRRAPALALSPAAVLAMLRRALPNAEVLAVAPQSGGLSNTNLRVVLAAGRAVNLRLYQGTAETAGKEHALAALLAGAGVAHARFLYLDPADPPWAVQECIEGERLDTLLPRLDPAGRLRCGEAVGRVLAAIHAIPFPHAGFLDAAARVGPPIDLGATGLLDFLRERVVHGRAGPRLGAARTALLMDFAARQAPRLEDWMPPAGLVHGDFNPTNLLLRPSGGTWAVAAVLDWEYALAGYPPLDFGNLLRLPREPEFIDGLAAGYRDGGGHLPAEWRHIATIADLFAWADTLSRDAEEDPALRHDAIRNIDALLSRSPSRSRKGR
jgi:aminoglycoside phosphotransferase (APT) family kinase protein